MDGHSPITLVTYKAVVVRLRGRVVREVDIAVQLESAWYLTQSEKLNKTRKAKGHTRSGGGTLSLRICIHVLAEFLFSKG